MESLFPWELGVFDAHCHPTDTLATLGEIPHMKAKVLTVMATRAQDQDLVAKTADDFGVFTVEDAAAVAAAAARSSSSSANANNKILPAFGWHPWFSHHMFDEAEYHGTTSLTPEQKILHYQSVLLPPRSAAAAAAEEEDLDFLRTLPDPRPFRHFLEQTRSYLRRYPLAMVGEVGLDKSFRIPENWLLLPPPDPDDDDDDDDDDNACRCGEQSENGLPTTPGGREGRRLSPYRVSMDHQKKVLLAQLALAGELERAVSVHGVQAHGILYETLAQTWRGRERRKVSKKERRRADHNNRNTTNTITAQPGGDEEEEKQQQQQHAPKPYPPRICLHSFSGPAETVKQYIASTVPCQVFFSFSTTINAWAERGAEGKVEAAVQMVPDDRVLVESDLHTAGDRMDACLEAAVRKICEVKGWALDEGVERLARNWRHFALGVQ